MLTVESSGLVRLRRLRGGLTAAIGTVRVALRAVARRARGAAIIRLGRMIAVTATATATTTATAVTRVTALAAPTGKIARLSQTSPRHVKLTPTRSDRDRDIKDDRDRDDRDRRENGVSGDERKRKCALDTKQSDRQYLTSCSHRQP